MNRDIRPILVLMSVLIVTLWVTMACVFYQTWKQQQTLRIIVPIIIEAHPPKSQSNIVSEEDADPSLQMYRDRNAISGGE